MVCCSQVTIGYFAYCTCTLESFLRIFSGNFPLFSLKLQSIQPGLPSCRCLMLKTKTLNNESTYVNISFSGLLLSGDN